MAINQRLDLKQGQTLTMTPQLQQAIKLLQMSNLELTEFVEAELEKNPLLERDESMSAERHDAPSSEPQDGGSSEGQDNSSEHGEDMPQASPDGEGESRDEAGPGLEPAAAPERELDADFGNVFTGEGMAEQ